MSDPIPFSTALRERSSGAHSSSEGAGFMSDLMTGEGTRDDYIALVAQHWFIYEALERGGRADAPTTRSPRSSSATSSRGCPRSRPTSSSCSAPTGATQVAPLPTTQRYVDRIDEVGRTWAGGFVAHHYTRYLGDLSGGQFIGRLMARRFGFETNGIGFYLFDDIADPKAFKEVYREQLDAAPWDAAEQRARHRRGAARLPDQHRALRRPRRREGASQVA